MLLAAIMFYGTEAGYVAVVLLQHRRGRLGQPHKMMLAGSPVSRQTLQRLLPGNNGWPQIPASSELRALLGAMWALT
jgi:hypothetical protein